MRFWDSSALVALLVGETESATVGRLLREDPQIVMWWGTAIECASALQRGLREGKLTIAAVSGATERLKDLESDANEIAPGGPVKTKARSLLATHPLTAGDALQLAAAFVWSDDAPAGHDLVTLDLQLAEAARREGFTVLPESAAHKT